MIPDNVLDECLNLTEQSTTEFIDKMNIKPASLEEIRTILSSQYDIRLLHCLQQKNYAHLLEPDNKGDLVTTKIELRKAEYFKKCEEQFLK